MEEKIIFKYSCIECGAEFQSEGEKLIYCDSEKCLDKDHRLTFITE